MNIRLHKLSSTPKFFEPITFTSGINLILGEKSKGDTPQSRKVNGVGKSLCVECIHFTLLRAYKDTRLSKLPKDECPDGLVIILDLSIGSDRLQIRRSIEQPDQPTIVRNDRSVTFTKLEDATRFLSDLLFAGQESGFSSFRGLMSLLMRNEESGFSSILSPMPTKRSAPADRLPHLYLLGLDVAPYSRLLKTIKEIDSQTKVIKQLRDDLTRKDAIKLKDVPAELNVEKQQVEKIKKGLNTLRAEPAFTQVEEDLNQLEIQLNALRAKRKGIRFKIDQIRSLPQPETINETDLEIVYDRIQAGLGQLVKKSLNQARAFKKEIEAFQRSLLEDELGQLEKEHDTLNAQIRELSKQHSEIVHRVDRKGSLKELSVGFNMAVHKQNDYHRRAALYTEYKSADNRKEDLKSERQDLIDEVRAQLSSQSEIEDSMNCTVANIHERIMQVHDASFTFNLKTASTAKQPLEFDMRIRDDGSKSINQTKVFIYDCALMFADCTKGRHPGFLLHDNIFDVDQDTLVQCLNFLQEQEDSGEDFQYILTLNREKIYAEERTNLIKLDVEMACRASFTKNKPFLRFRYQELGN